MMQMDCFTPCWTPFLQQFFILLLNEFVRIIRGVPVRQTEFASSSSPNDSLWPSLGNNDTNITGTSSVVHTTNPNNSTTLNSPSETDQWNETGNGNRGGGSGDSFVEDHAGMWVIGVMSGTCILTIAFIVRALFSRAEAFRDPQENIFAQDGLEDHMGFGFGTANGNPSGTDFGYV